MTTKSNDYEKLLKQQSRSKFFVCPNCCLMQLSIVVILILLLSSALAASGLVKIPVLNYLFYKEPQPIEVITPTEISIDEKLNSAIDSKNKKLLLIINQEELTHIISQNQKLRNSQIAIADDQMELFSINNGFDGNEIYITIKFIPEVKNDQLDLKITKVRVGNLPIPRIFATWVKNFIWKYYGRQLLYFDKIEVSDIDIKKGEITISGQPKNSLLELDIFNIKE